MISYAVSQATQEIGIRMALGAGRGNVLQLVFGYGGALLAVGLIIGIPAALGAGRLISSQLSEVTPWNPLTYVGVAAILVATGMLACAIPAARAAQLDPQAALRDQ